MEAAKKPLDCSVEGALLEVFGRGSWEIRVSVTLITIPII